MKVYSVTVSYEDERQGQWVESLAILAPDPASAGQCAQEYVAGAEPFAADLTVVVGAEWQGTLRPRIVATLIVDPDDHPVWREYR